MIFALVGIFCTRCKIYDDSNVVSISNDGSFIGTSESTSSISNKIVSNHGNNGQNSLNGGKLKLLVQKPCFKIIVALLSIGGIIAYSIFANMCYYKLNCEEIHPYVVFIPVSYFDLNWILIHVTLVIHNRILVSMISINLFNSRSSHLSY